MQLGTVLLVLVIYVLAVMRVTRLANYDTLVDPLRVALGSRARDSLGRSSAERRRWHMALVFLSCPWCIGFWVALATAIVPVQLVDWPVWTIIPLALAANQITGMLAFLSADDMAVEDIEPD